MTEVDNSQDKGKERENEGKEKEQDMRKEKEEKIKDKESNKKGSRKRQMARYEEGAVGGEGQNDKGNLDREVAKQLFSTHRPFMGPRCGQNEEEKEGGAGYYADVVKLGIDPNPTKSAYSVSIESEEVFILFSFFFFFQQSIHFFTSKKSFRSY